MRTLKSLQSILLCALFCFFAKTAFPQAFNPALNVGGKIGVARLITETDFSTGGNEFYNHPGIAFDFEVSKYLSPHWELGAEFERTVLNGDNDLPYFSANGIHPVHVPPVTEAVEYQNKLTGQNVFLRFFIRPADEGFKFAPFLKAGIGYKNYKSELKYKEPPLDPDAKQLIFGKGSVGQANLSTAVFSSGLGFKTSITQQVYLLANFDLNMVHYDFLDVVHNYDTAGDRSDVYGIYSQFKIGVFYTIKGEPKEKSSKKESRRKHKTPSPKYLPFAPN